MEKLINNVSELLSAVMDTRIGVIVLTTDLADVPSFDLLPGQTLRSAAGQRFALAFLQGVDGVRLSSDNSILSLDLHASLELTVDSAWRERIPPRILVIMRGLEQRKSAKSPPSSSKSSLSRESKNATQKER